MIDFKIIPDAGSHSLADCSIFNSIEYCGISDRQNQHILIVECLLNNEKLIFPFEVFESKLLTFGRFLYQPTYIDGRIPTKEQENAILNSWLAYLKKGRIVHRITQPNTASLFQSFPTGATYCPFGSYRIDLQLPTEVLLKNLHPKHRNGIRSAEKKGAYIKVGNSQLETFHHLYESTMSRSNMHAESLTYFKGLFDSVGVKNLFCGVVYSVDHEPQGAVLVPFTNFGAHYIWGASAEKVKVTGAINYLHYSMMMDLKKNGVKFYDFVGARLSDVTGTKLDGIQKFKKRFGGILHEGYLWKADINKLRCNIYDLIAKITGRAKGMDIIDQEIIKLN